jgi:glutamyl-Q tRNA(Asp) synthetase
LGALCFDLQRLGGDFVVRRADGLFAYQLATVVDDIALGVTDVVRGIDLLGSVPRQLHLYQALGQLAPSYLHHPVVIAGNRLKLAKSSGAHPVDRRHGAAVLARVLSAIGIPGVDTGFAATGPSAIDALLEHARWHWRPELLPTRPIPAADLDRPG